VREAIDFLRYYANEAERIMQPVMLPGPTGESNELRLTARGVWVCISPWNFPLAIFTGQVAAALATGNTCWPSRPSRRRRRARSRRAAARSRRAGRRAAAAARPRRNRRRRAGRRAAHGRRGVHRLDPGRANHQRALAAKDGPIVPLIAETGGINAMLVDSTRPARAGRRRRGAERVPLGRPALLGAAPAVRARGIADGVIEMIRARRGELVAGDPACCDRRRPGDRREAADNIRRHLKRLDSRGEADCTAFFFGGDGGNLIAPQAFEVRFDRPREERDLRPGAARRALGRAT
jgi:RHH-type proline utilization regulon transcriptional repressor/proline dehydrogenase/delta 1-pyrroline-5-carboxylate dehydrogenase